MFKFVFIFCLQCGNRLTLKAHTSSLQLVNVGDLSFGPPGGSCQCQEETPAYKDWRARWDLEFAMKGEQKI